MQSSEGILSAIRKSSNVIYGGKPFSLDDITELFKNANKRRSSYEITVSPYMQACLKGDKKEMAYYEKQMRAQDFGKRKMLIQKYGIKKAKVVRWLDKNGNTNWAFGTNWRFWKDKYFYKGIGDGEDDFVMLIVRLEEDRFSISVSASDSGGYMDNYFDCLSKNISFDSVLNQLSYFQKRLKNKAY